MSTGSVKRIDTSSFDDVINSIGTAITEYSTAKTAIMTSTEALLDTWTGKGKDAFLDAYTLLKTELSDEEENLKTMKDDLASMKESYEEWDKAMKESLSKQ